MDAAPEALRAAAPIPIAGVLPDLALSPTTILVASKDGTVVYANHGLHGEVPQDVVGRPVADLVDADHAERLKAALQVRAPETFELGKQGPSGAIQWWQVDASPIPGGGTLLVLADVTKRRLEIERLKRSESLLIDAQGVAHMGTWDWDVSQPHAEWSTELYRIYGLTPEDYTPSYEGYLEMVHPDDRERVMRVTEACFKEHMPYSHDERIFRPTGEMRWLHTWATPVLDGSGKLVRLVGVCQDITEQRKAESAVRGQVMARTLARRLLHDLIQGARVPERVVRDIGRAVAHEQRGEPTVDAYTVAFRDMGFGELRLDQSRDGRYEFVARDLLERRPQSNLPTCLLTLGFVEGTVSAITGGSAMGNEMRCQSMGHPECRFVVQAPGQR